MDGFLREAGSGRAVGGVGLPVTLVLSGGKIINVVESTELQDNTGFSYRKMMKLVRDCKGGNCR